MDFFIKGVVGIIIALFSVPIFFRTFKRPFDCFVRNEVRGSKVDTFACLIQVNLLGVFLSYFIGNPIVAWIPGDYGQQIAFILIILIIIGTLRLININYRFYESHDIVIWSCCGIAIIIFNVVVVPGYLQSALEKISTLENQQFQLMTLTSFFGSGFAVLFVELYGQLIKKLEIRPNSNTPPSGNNQPSP